MRPSLCLRERVLRVGPTPDGKGARDVTVVPVPSERELRSLAWVDGNRDAVVEKAMHPNRKLRSLQAQNGG